MRPTGAFRVGVLALAVFISTGCATIFKGPNKSIHISSQSPGAEVLQEGQFKGNTPMNLQYSGSMYCCPHRLAQIRSTWSRLTNQPLDTEHTSTPTGTKEKGPRVSPDSGPFSLWRGGRDSNPRPPA